MLQAIPTSVAHHGGNVGSPLFDSAGFTSWEQLVYVLLLCLIAKNKKD